MISRLRSLLAGTQSDLYTILDIGTVEAKALILLIEGEQAAIVGAGSHPHQAGAMVNGSLADAKIAAQACEQALSRAEAMTEIIAGEKLIADHAILGISGPLLKSICLPLTIRRQRPDERITEGELRSLVQRAERVLLQQAREHVTAERLIADGEVGLVDANVVHIIIDGQIINTVIGATGAQVEVCLSNVFAPVSYLAAVASVAAALDLRAVAIVGGASAVSRAPSVVSRRDAIIIDMGGECTDVALIRRGGLEKLQTLPMGGMSLTRRVARTLGVPTAAAEEIKRAYAGRQLDEERAAELRPVLAADAQTWIDGIHALLQDMAGQEPLPAQIILCGGGIALPDVTHVAHAYPWLRVLPFARQPQVAVVQARTLLGDIADRTRQLHSHSASIPAALAAWAVQSLRPAPITTVQHILSQVLHGMGLA